jgi:glycosyltransferase involved in cell wall biosynthesis
VTRQPLISIIVPVYNGRPALESCLAALCAHLPPDAEIIVVDDGSTDGSGAVATRMGARVLRLDANAGPAAARNVGARNARGDIFFFVDSDVAVAPGALDRVRVALDPRADAAAVFGSYDMNPSANGIVSRYKNLLHHFVHQNADTEAGTFWSGCGAIRRRVFEEIRGFDQERFRRSSIEDIELGYRLRRAGYRIRLDKALQGTHLKRWTFRSLLWTDVMGRAVPWSRLILERRQLIDDLNLRREQRWSAALVALSAIGLLLVPWRAEVAVLPVAALFAVIWLNRRLYAFFVQRGGVCFAGACIALHWLYYFYSGLAYLAAWVGARLRSQGRSVHGD